MTFRLNEAQVNDNLTRELGALARLSSYELDLLIDEHIQETRELSTSDIVVDKLLEISQANKPETSQPAITHYLRSVHEKLSTILELTVVDANGNIISSSSESPSVIVFPSGWSYHESTNVVTTPPHWNKRYATATIDVSIPILSDDSLAIGALVATFDLRNMQSNLENMSKLSLGEVLVLDASGNVLLSSYPGIELPMSLDPSIIRRLNKYPKQPAVFTGLLQQKVIGFAYTPEALPVIIVAEKDQQAITAAWVEMRDQFLVLVLLLIIVVAIVAFKMGQFIVVPLQRLIEATNRIVKGDLDVKLTVIQDDELGQLTQTFNQMTDKLRQNMAEISANEQVLRNKNKQLETLSTIDGLTGLNNRSRLNVIISDQLLRFKRNHRPFAVLMIDIDHFKTINDTLGHIAGDNVLAAVAKILSQSIRSVDYAARYGGDEFNIVLTETTADEALITAERIRKQVSVIKCGSADKVFAVALSIGIVQCQEEDTTPTLLMTRADNALYAAKRAGRNQAYCIRPKDTVSDQKDE